jgi:hypothetical protein
LAANDTNRTLLTPPPAESQEQLPYNNNETEPGVCMTSFGPAPGYCDELPQESCDENTPSGTTCIDEGDMPPNEETGNDEEAEPDTDNGFSEFVPTTDEESEDEETNSDEEEFFDGGDSGEESSDEGSDSGED